MNISPILVICTSNNIKYTCNHLFLFYEEEFHAITCNCYDSVR